MVITQNSQAWEQVIDESVDANYQEMVDIRRHLHMHPEPSGEEFRTTQYLSERLSDLDVQVTVPAQRRGLFVDVGDGAGRIGLRADIDGLRVSDQKSVPYCSTVPGVMHACGHDGHTATAYGALRALLDLREKSAEWTVPCRVLFQPAEESNQGALEMVEAGATEGLTGLLGLHMDPSRWCGTIGIRPGTFTADCHELEIEVIGVGAHAARPHEACDPIAAACQLISSIFLFVPRSTDSQDPVVISFGQFNAGHSANAIPDKVVVRGTLRTLSEGISLNTIKHLERLARGVAEASGTKIAVRSTHGPPSVENDVALTALIRSAANRVVGDEHVQVIARPSMGGEDFANYLKHVPGAMFRLGCAGEGMKAPPLHSPVFDIDERSMAIGAKILARAAVGCYQEQLKRE